MLKMFTRCLIFSIGLLFVFINAQNNNNINKVQRSAINIPVTENNIANDSDNQSSSTATESTLIRVTRLGSKPGKSNTNKRERRQLIEAIQTAGFVINVAKAIRNTESGEEILGMAKKVAIAVIVIVSLCIVCCLITTVVVCVKCCCNGNSRKRNKGQSAIQVPQPIFVHTGPAGYQPQYNQRYVPQTWSPAEVRSIESYPMLSRPSAPPQPDDHFHIEHPPPPYEKIYKNK